MTRFRKKPVVIEAMQFLGDNEDEIVEWSGRAVVAHPVINLAGDAVLRITTLEGDMLAHAGDWIIKGIKGEFYPCKPDIFSATYEEV